MKHFATIVAYVYLAALLVGVAFLLATVRVTTTNRLGPLCDTHHPLLVELLATCVLIVVAAVAFVLTLFVAVKVVVES